jgi:hypothetical protein
MDRRPLALAAAIMSTACAGHRPATPAQSAPLAAVAPSAPVSRDPTSLRYAAGSARYRIEQSSHVVQDLMGQSMTVDIGTRQLVSAVATEAAGNLSVALTVDSLEVTGAPPGADAPLVAARGRTFRLVMVPSGLVVSVTNPDSSNVLLRQVSDGLRDFFPRLPTVPAAGQAWTDTVSTIGAGEVSVAVRAIREHRVIGWEDRDGVRALHVASTSTYSVSGSGETQGQAVEVSGSGQSTRDSFISASGSYLGSIESDSASMTATVTAMGMTVPIRQSRRTTVSRLQ